MKAKKVQFSAEEAEIHRSMPPHRQYVLRHKNLLLLEYLRVQSGHEDERIVHDIAKGFDLTGVPTRSGAFLPKLRPREMSEDQLRKASVWINKAIAGKSRAASDHEMAKAIDEETTKEVKRHWLEGPFTAEQLTSRFPTGG